MNKYKTGSATIKSEKIPIESLVSLRVKLANLRERSPQRSILLTGLAEMYGISISTVRRKLKSLGITNKHRIDKGVPRKIEKSEMMSYCELIAAIKKRTTNKKGRHVSTKMAIEILEESGMETPNGLVKVPVGYLKVSTINYYLKLWGYDQRTLERESPAALYQATYSNDLWHFDLSTSEIKHLENSPEWVEEGGKNPTLMLYGVADDRSAVCYEEYHCVYGEDTEAALRFLFNAMSAKSTDSFPFMGIPKAIQMDNGPISKNRVFLRVLSCLGIKVIKHLPKGADGRKTEARSKSKIERPFRTIKEAHETLYHFHKPQTESEANRWLLKYLKKHSQKDHREDPCSRMEAWITNPPPEGIREMCSWEQFTRMAREPMQKKVGIHARLSVEGISYEVDPNLAGEWVTTWWGLFDNEIFVEFNDENYGPYHPANPLSSLPPYRRFKQTNYEIRANQVAELAKKLELPRAALENPDWKLVDYHENEQPELIPFSNPNLFHEFVYPNAVLAKRAIAEYLGQPITRLSQEEKALIDEILAESLVKKDIFEHIDAHFQSIFLLKSLDFSTGEKENYVN